MKRECPLPVGAHTWTYFRDSGGEAQERSINDEISMRSLYLLEVWSGCTYEVCRRCITV